MTNREFSLKDENFKQACATTLPETKPTKRQASKFRRGKGRAYKNSVA